MKLSRKWVEETMSGSFGGFLNPDPNEYKGSVFKINPTLSENMGYYSVEEVHAAIQDLHIKAITGIASDSDKLLYKILIDSNLLKTDKLKEQ
jgi:hypothetical protein